MKASIWALIAIVCLLVGFGIYSAQHKTDSSGPPLDEVDSLTQPADTAPDDTQEAATLPHASIVERDAMRARYLTQACWVWSQDHHGQMPDDLATLVINGLVTPEQLVAERTGTPPLAVTKESLEQARKDPAAFARELDAHCDYVYLGKGIGGTQLDDNTITQQVAILYEKPSAKLQGQLNIGFIDGHIEHYPPGRLGIAFTATNAFLKQSGKPEVNVAALRSAAKP
jgi:prepilin-type processing-associated H-X9-DG protein